MIANRPAIYIYVKNADSQLLREVCSGIEEEGVFFEIIEKNENELNKLAYDAANESMLGSGIGINGCDVAFCIRGMKLGKNVEQYHSPTAEESRKIGTNSARSVKKQFFK